jgi:hypothetical protein
VLFNVSTGEGMSSENMADEPFLPWPGNGKNYGNFDYVNDERNTISKPRGKSKNTDVEVERSPHL